jgi:hypothetical protein
MIRTLLHQIITLLPYLGLYVLSVTTALYLGYICYKQYILPSIAAAVLQTDDRQARQLKSTEARVSKNAKAKIGEDLIRNSPLGMFLQYLSEDTREYLNAHPEALPEVAQQWLPTIKYALQILPELGISVEQLVKQPKTNEQVYDF